MLQSFYSKVLKTSILLVFFCLAYTPAQAQMTPEERAAAAYKDNALQPAKLKPGVEKVAGLQTPEEKSQKEAAEKAATAAENLAKEQAGGDGRVSREESTILSRHSRFRETFEK